jgi:GTPase SAR1 family protein
MQRDYDFIFKVCLLGSSGVGKTALLKRYADDHF